MRTAALLSFALLAAMSVPAQSRDGFADGGRPVVCDMPNGPRLKQCQDWIENVRQPDVRDISCCADADAFLADDFEVKNGTLYAILSADYPGRPGYEDVPFRKGQRIAIPPNKINRAREDGGNPSGHGVVFMLPGSGIVLCYFGPTLS